MKNIIIFLFIIILSLNLTAEQSVFSEQEEGITEKVPHRVPINDLPINIDAVLDEEAWDDALRMSLNYEVDPGENIEPPVETEVLIFYSKTHLYVAFIAYDPDPSAIRARISERDHTWSDDRVAIILDTYNDERRTYNFFCNPLGVQSDQIESSYGAGGSWDGIWNSAGRITEEGYIVEMSIPFRTLNFQRSEGDQIWGVDAVRSYPRNVRHHIGLFPRDRNLNCYMCQAEKLIGFQGATPGRNIEIDPTFSMLVAQARENFTEGNFENTEERYDPGITAHWGFTPNMKLNLTINPDFSQIEADAAQIDVNRQFAYYYGERRPFFLEGADFFGFNIPIIRFRSYADPEWGVKLAGKIGSHSIGICVVQDSITNLLLPTSFYTTSTSIERKNLGSVLRYRKDLGVTSNFGLIISDREGEDYYNRGAGVDGRFNFTRLDGVNFAAAYSRTKYPEEISTDFGEPDTAFDGWSVQGGYYHNSRSINWNTNFWVTSPEYRADLGHIYQSDYKNVTCGLSYTWYDSPDHWYNRFNIGGGYDYEDNFGDTLVYKGGKLWMHYKGPKQSYVSLFTFYGKKTYEGLEFDNRMIDLTIQFCPLRNLFLFLDIEYGDEIDYTNIQPGKRLALSPYAECTIGRHLYIELNHDFEQLNVDGGRLYTANITNLTLKYHFSHRTFIRGILQCVHYNFNTALYPYTIDSVNKHIFSQFLFSYRVNPQTVLYLGYSDNYYGDDIEPIVQTDRTFFAKIGYSFII